MNFFISLSLTIIFFSIAAVSALVPPSHNVKGKIYRVKEDVDISFEGWYDPKAHRSRIDYFNSATKTYQLPFQNTKSRFYKIVPASDGDRNWTTCFNTIVKQVSFQPTIPMNIDRRNKRKDIVNGTLCTLYTQIRKVSLHSYTALIVKKYWVRENGASEIPVRYEYKMIKTADIFVVKHYLIEYDDYKEASIPSEVFKVDRKFVNNCEVDDDAGTINPMRSYIKVDDTSHAEVMRLNLEFIDRINKAEFDYKLGVNKFIDWTHKKYVTLLRPTPSPSAIDNEHELYPSENDRIPVKLPDELDLRKLGFVTPVKDQMNCGSCYAFCALGSLEGAYYKRYKTLKSLSEEAIVDCGWIRLNQGCFGGAKDYVFLWAKRHGVPAYSDYYRKYSGIENYCVLSNQVYNVTVKEYRFVQSKSIEALKQALVNYGPVAVSINASLTTFQFYSSGVYNDPACPSKKPNHCVLVVGYGVEKGIPYWLIKNSYGSAWGEDGYIKISQRNNLCGVLDRPAFAIVN